MSEFARRALFSREHVYCSQNVDRLVVTDLLLKVDTAVGDASVVLPDCPRTVQLQKGTRLRHVSRLPRFHGTWVFTPRALTHPTPAPIHHLRCCGTDSACFLHASSCHRVTVNVEISRALWSQNAIFAHFFALKSVCSRAGIYGKFSLGLMLSPVHVRRGVCKAAYSVTCLLLSGLPPQCLRALLIHPLEAEVCCI